MKRLFRAIQEENSWIQLLFFGILTAASLIFFSLAGQLLSILLYGYPAMQEALSCISAPDACTEVNERYPSHVTEILYITQITSQVGLFIIPPFLYIMLGRISQPDLPQWMRKKPGMFSLLMTSALVIIILPLITWLTDVNMSIPLPDALIHAEENAGALVQMFFNDSGTGRFVLNLLMIAVIPAIGEEFFFRGIIQQNLARGLRNTHLAVLATAILFSFFHFQFQGFIPRVMLGLIFGYLMVWTGSVWVPVAAHFINNGAAVLVEFLAQRNQTGVGYLDFGRYESYRTVLFSFLMTAFICFILWYMHTKASAQGNRQP